jgi:hypothetical protein
LANSTSDISSSLETKWRLEGVIKDDAKYSKSKKLEECQWTKLEAWRLIN